MYEEKINKKYFESSKNSFYIYLTIDLNQNKNQPYESNPTHHIVPNNFY
jgi:hypothetical protein